MPMGVLPTWMSVDYLHAQELWRPSEGIRSPGVTDAAIHMDDWSSGKAASYLHPQTNIFCHILLRPMVCMERAHWTY